MILQAIIIISLYLSSKFILYYLLVVFLLACDKCKFKDSKQEGCLVTKNRNPILCIIKNLQQSYEKKEEEEEKTNTGICEKSND